MKLCSSGHATNDDLLKCKSCGMPSCETCWSGGRSGTAGKVARGVAALYTAGLSEAARWAFRKASRECPHCGHGSFVRL